MFVSFREAQEGAETPKSRTTFGEALKDFAKICSDTGQDLAKLYEVLEQARSPTGLAHTAAAEHFGCVRSAGLLVAKLGEMECGQFVGKAGRAGPGRTGGLRRFEVKPDRNIERLATRYNLAPGSGSDSAKFGDESAQDTRVVSRLTELRRPRQRITAPVLLSSVCWVRVRRKRTQQEDFNRLEQHLSLCKRPLLL